MFGLEIKKSAQKYLSKIPIQYRDRIFLGLGAICMGKTENLHIIKLQGTVRDLYRMRIGIYRVVYYIDDSVLKVVVIEISNRGDAYKTL